AECLRVSSEHWHARGNARCKTILPRTWSPRTGLTPKRSGSTCWKACAATSSANGKTAPCGTARPKNCWPPSIKRSRRSRKGAKPGAWRSGGRPAPELSRQSLRDQRREPFGNLVLAHLGPFLDGISRDDEHAVVVAAHHAPRAD